MHLNKAPVSELMQELVPWVRTMGLEFIETTADKVVIGLPDNNKLHNHIGGPHAAMMFGAAETASGTLILLAFADQLADVTPLPITGRITFSHIARGYLQATATLKKSPAQAITELRSGVRPEIPVHVELTNAEGTATGNLEIIWTLKPAGTK